MANTQRKPRLEALLLACALPVLGVSLVRGGEPAPGRTLRYKLTWTSSTTFVLQNMKQESLASTSIVYAREERPSGVAVSIEDMHVRSTANGKVTFDVRMGKDGLWAPGPDGALQKAPPEQLGPVEKDLLQNGFGMPFLWLETDATGKELSRKVSESEAAKLFLENGMDANCTLFHAPFDAALKTWKTPVTYKMSGGGKAVGEFGYTLQETEKGESNVEVEGQLKAAEIDVGDPNTSARNFVFTGKGKQAFDTQRGHWTRGQIKGPLSMDFIANGQKAFTMEGTLEFNLELLP
ncbi:MAG: hypothetical protein M5U26_24450 [Planctomycetota bacterium]|nr:hypothetical protein [Planctomycetota bacterium]